MKLFKDKRYKTPIKVESCDGCPLEAKIPFKGYNGIVFHNKVCLGLNHRAWGTYGPELIHPSTENNMNLNKYQSTYIDQPGMYVVTITEARAIEICKDRGFNNA